MLHKHRVDVFIVRRLYVHEVYFVLQSLVEGRVTHLCTDILARSYLKCGGTRTHAAGCPCSLRPGASWY